MSVYALHAAHSNVGGAAHSQHTLVEAQQESELRQACVAAAAQTPMITDPLLHNKSDYFSQMQRLNTVQHLQTQCMTSANEGAYADII